MRSRGYPPANKKNNLAVAKLCGSINSSNFLISRNNYNLSDRPI